MARYHEIEASIWDDPDLQSKPKDQKLLYIYLFSNPLCRPSGLYRITLKTIDFHLGLGRALQGAWEGLQDGKPLIMYDEKLSLLWVVGKLKRYIKSLDDNNPIKRSVDRDIEEYKSSSLIGYFLKKYEGAYKPLPGVDIPIPKDIPIKGGPGGRKPEKEKPTKKQFLEFVLLTDQELKNLIEKFGEKTTQIWIERLNNYIGSKGAKYKSHYHTILNWNNRNPLPASKPGQSISSAVKQPEISVAEREALAKQIHEFAEKLKKENLK